MNLGRGGERLAVSLLIGLLWLTASMKLEAQEPRYRERTFADLRDSDMEVRNKVAWALIAIGAPAVPALATEINRAVQQRQFAQALRAFDTLARLQGEVKESKLLRVRPLGVLTDLLADHDPNMRKLTAEALGELGDRGVNPALTPSSPT